MKILTILNKIETVVDNDVYEWASKIDWRIKDGNYFFFQKGSKRFYLHRLIANTPEGFVTDHINGDTLDNLKSNLRVTSNRENLFNFGIRCDNTSGYRGVWFRKSINRWVAEIKKDGKKYHLGSYKTAEEAATVYNEKAKEVFGKYARLNNIKK